MKKNKRHVQFEEDLLHGLHRLRLDDIAWLALNFERCISLIQEMGTYWNAELDRNPRDYIHGQWIKEAKAILRQYNQP